MRRRSAPRLQTLWSAAYHSLLPLTSLASIHAFAAQACGETQRVTIARDAPWRCEMTFQPGRSYLVRADQTRADLTVELLDPAGASVIKVDSPTRRAGPELLLANARKAGLHTIVVETNGGGPTTIAVSDTTARAATRGLAMLTSAAAVRAEPRAEDAAGRLATLRAALEQLRSAAAEAYEAETLFRIAALDYWIRRSWSDAARSAQAAMDAFERSSDPVMRSQAAILRASSLIDMAQAAESARSRGPRSETPEFREAETLLAEAVQQFRASGRRYDEAHAINSLGIASFYQGRNDEARARYVTAAGILRELGERASEVSPLQNIAVLDWDRGDYARAAESYEQLLKRLEPEHDYSDHVALLNNLALAYDVLGNTDRALQAYLAALSITERYGYDAGRARTLHGLGTLYIRLGDSERGGQFLEQALALRRSMHPPDRRGLFFSLIRVGDWHRDRGDSVKAVKLHVEASESAVSPAQKARTFLAIGRDHMDADSVGQAIAAYERGLALALPEDWPVRVMLKSAYGYAKLRSGDPIGYSLISSAASAHEEHGDDELAGQDYVLLAQEDLRADRTENALRNIRRALALFEAQRAGAMNPDLRASYLANRSTAYELQAEIYMTLADEARKQSDRDRLRLMALITAEARRTRALLDFQELARPDARHLDRELRTRQHRLASLLDQQEPPLEKVAALRQEIGVLKARLDLMHADSPGTDRHRTSAASLQSVEALRLSIPADTVVLAYLLGESRSWLWSMTREGVRTFELARRDEMNRAASELHELWSRPIAQPSDRSRENEFSRVIFGGVPDVLAQKQNVEVIPDGALRHVPFGALRAPANGGASGRLAETHVVSLRLSLHFAARAESSRANGNRILLVGDPVGTTSDTGLPHQNVGIGATRLAALPGSRREIAIIANIADITADWRADALTGRAATKPAFLQKPLADYRVLHFATHAKLDVASPQLSTIVLSRSSSDVGAWDSGLSLREIVGLDLKADMVVLSACDGSLGKDYRGQLSFGLSEAFLLAGSSSVVGSLWRVSDAAAQRYMTLFYDQYVSRGASPAVAAQRAARAMMGDPKYAHPFYWAAFVVLTSQSPKTGGRV
ncbi:MAG: CHAT domain-containing protein [Steroidobacteraceae bacterium]